MEAIRRPVRPVCKIGNEGQRVGVKCYEMIILHRRIDDIIKTIEASITISNINDSKLFIILNSHVSYICSV